MRFPRFMDDEFVRIAIFRLEHCSKWLLELSEQVQSRALRRRLLQLSRQLTAHAEALADGCPEPSADE
jgi:hypothetical protein